MDQDWKAAIADYDRKVADGEITFRHGKFADGTPAEVAPADAELAEWVRDNTLPV
jgi:hypothetical protein